MPSLASQLPIQTGAQSSSFPFVFRSFPGWPITRTPGKDLPWLQESRDSHSFREEFDKSSCCTHSQISPSTHALSSYLGLGALFSCRGCSPCLYENLVFASKSPLWRAAATSAQFAGPRPEQ